MAEWRCTGGKSPRTFALVKGTSGKELFVQGYRSVEKITIPIIPAFLDQLRSGSSIGKIIFIIPGVFHWRPTGF